MIGVELLIIDAATDPWQFQKEVQWNQVYWHLAGSV
jgi:L-arabinose isomerase